MKKTLFIASLLIILVGCEKNDYQEPARSENFKELELFDLRTLNLLPSLRLIDYLDKIVQIDPRYPYYDTLGRTEVTDNGRVIFDYQWTIVFHSPMHCRTRVLYGFISGHDRKTTEKIIFIGGTPDRQAFDQGVIIRSDLTVKYFPIIAQDINKLEIDVEKQRIRITSNRTWWILGPYPDEITIVDY